MIQRTKKPIIDLVRTETTTPYKNCSESIFIDLAKLERLCRAISDWHGFKEFILGDLEFFWGCPHGK
ncbi:hypothetical protein CP336_06455 [Pseudomonas fluorescens]|nr:hypothetical protein CP336_06455 [Pseudomonas fluorescens]